MTVVFRIQPHVRLQEWVAEEQGVVPQPYTREMFERSHTWMQTWDLLDPGIAAGARYDDVVL